MNDSDRILQRIDDYFARISVISHSIYLGGIGCEYYPTPIKFITDALNIIKEKELNFSNMTFLDVGCGIGNMCAVATHLGFKAEGIELNPVLYGIAKELYEEVRFHNVDLRNFNEFDKYDIIFYYAPLIDEKAQRTLKAKVEDTVRVGTYIIACGWTFERTKDDRFISIYLDESKFREVWQKIK